MTLMRDADDVEERCCATLMTLRSEGHLARSARKRSARRSREPQRVGFSSPSSAEYAPGSAALQVDRGSYAVAIHLTQVSNSAYEPHLRQRET
jgi:hypothetical protein